MIKSSIYMQKALSTFILLLVFSICSFAQFDKAFFEWESHLPRKTVLQLDQYDNYIFAATKNNLIKINIEENATVFYSKVNGLSDVDIAKVAYVPKVRKLFIAYENGNFDLLDDFGNVENIPDLLINTSFIGNKKINNLTVEGERVFLACPFGVLVINTETLNSGFTTNMELQVNDIAYYNGSIYAAAEDGIYQFDESESNNPGFFENWKHLGTSFDLPELYKATNIEQFNGALYAAIDNEIYVLIDDTFEKLVAQDIFDHSIISMRASKDYLLVTDGKEIQSRILYIDKNGAPSKWQDACSNIVSDAIMDKNDRIWFGDKWHYLKYQDGVEGTCQSYNYNSPYSSNTREIRTKDGDIYVGSGSINENFGFDSNRDGFFVRKNGNWINFNANKIPLINEKEMINFLVAQPHPTENKVYAGAFPGGILEYDFDTEKATVFNNENSLILGPADNLGAERVSEIKFDDEGNMWATCFLAKKGLVARTKDGEWYNFKAGSFINMGAIEFDRYGYIWIQLGGSSGGVLIYDHNNTISDPSDDRYKVFTSNNSSLNSSRVRSLSKDNNGDIWVGTDSGPVAFDCGDPFEGCNGSIIKVLQDSIPALLLQTEVITSITIDGGNRKWFGSANGIFVQSPNGIEQVNRFTTSNSPLFSETILDVEFDGKKGEIHIATSKGLQSIRIPSTTGTKKFVDNSIRVFPNPVRPEYKDLIGINGLAENANIKITDAQGLLVYEGQAIGGTATWNGRDLSGNEVASGVYTVFATVSKNLKKPSTSTSKFVIIR